MDMKNEIAKLIKNPKALSEELGSLENSSLIHLINETAQFVQFLIAKGHGFILKPADIFCQKDEETCCWHSVFCLGQEMGQALSFFAVRS